MRIQGSSRLLVAATALALAGCAGTKAGDASKIEFSGFLSDYSRLSETRNPDRASYLYIRPGLDLGQYRAIILDPVEARISSRALMSAGEKDMTFLLTAFNDGVQKAVGGRWTLATEPGPGVLRARFAITEADASSAIVSPFTRILPQGLVASGAVDMVSECPINAGRVNGECELVDSVTGEQLIAGVDRRVGNNAIQNTFQRWGDVLDALALWSDRVARVLEENGLRATK